MSTFTESTVEDAALAWLEAVGWQTAHSPDITPGGVIFMQTFHQKVQCIRNTTLQNTTAAVSA